MLCMVLVLDLDFTMVLLNHQNMLWLNDGAEKPVCIFYLLFYVYCLEKCDDILNIVAQIIVKYSLISPMIRINPFEPSVMPSLCLIFKNLPVIRTLGGSPSSLCSVWKLLFWPTLSTNLVVGASNNLPIFGALYTPKAKKYNYTFMWPFMFFVIYAYEIFVKRNSSPFTIQNKNSIFKILVYWW